MPTTPATTTVTLPRWIVRVTLALCPAFAAMIALFAWTSLRSGVPGGWTAAVMWMGMAGFSCWCLLLGGLYLRRETGLAPWQRMGIGALGGLVLAATGLLALANLAAIVKAALL